MVVLVDRGTASAAEIVTGALKDRGRAKVVGTHTYGKGVFQEIDPLPNGGALDFTVGEYFTPNGHNLGGGGVQARARASRPTSTPYTNPSAKIDTALHGRRADGGRRGAVSPANRRFASPAAAGRGAAAARQVPRRRAVLRSRARGSVVSRDRKVAVGDLIVVRAGVRPQRPGGRAGDGRRGGSAVRTSRAT